MGTKPTGKKKTSRKKARKRSRAGVRPRDASGLTANQRTFLKVFHEVGQISATADAVGVTRKQHYVWYKGNKKYKAKFEEALDIYNELDTDRVLDEVNKRAYDGWDEETIVEEVEAETIIVKGADGKDEVKSVPNKKKIRRTKVHKWSIAALLWKANFRHGNPQHYVITGRGGGPIEVHNPLTAALEEMWVKLNGGSGNDDRPVRRALPATVQADVIDVQDVTPVDGKQKNRRE